MHKRKYVGDLKERMKQSNKDFFSRMTVEERKAYNRDVNLRYRLRKQGLMPPFKHSKQEPIFTEEEIKELNENFKNLLK